MTTLANLRYRIQQKFIIINAANASDVLSVADVNLLAVGKPLRMYFAFLAARKQLCAGATGLLALGEILMILMAYAFTIYL